MIDSGASSTFINESFVERHCIPSIPHTNPIPLNVIDGSSISSGAVTHHTTPLSLSINAHSEDCSFHIIPIHKYDIVLGISWLRKHDPTITWSKNSIKFESRFCHHHCLPSSLNLTSLNRLTSGPSLNPFAATSFFTQPKINESRPEPQINISFISASTANYLLTRSKRHKDCTVGLAIASIATDTQKTKTTPEIPAVYQQFSRIFSEVEASSLPKHQPWDHNIPLQPNTQPPFGPIYALSEVELKALREYLDENLSKGFIRHSSSPAGAPILFVKKKDGSLRLCVDYRGLNRITVKNRYPIPLISELLDRIRGSKYFTKLDLRGAYNLIRIAEGEEWKTAFRTRYGHFEYTVMPFGLTNAPASFQSLVNEVLRPYLDYFVIAFLDDILIFSKTLEEHEQHVTKVLQKLNEYNLFVKAEKCMFHASEVPFLGYLIGEKGIRMDPAKVEAVTTWPTPKNTKEVMSFLGLANFYRRFIPQYSHIATALTRLLRKDQPFEWTSECQQAFERLKKAFTQDPILRHFDPELPAIVETDASDFAIGACLLQRDATTKRLHPVAYYSRKLTPAEVNYEIHDKELLSIVAALREWRVYLEGAKHQIQIYSDHKNLEKFTTTKVLNRRQARWSEMLASYDFVITHTAGTQNGRADALSRRPDYFESASDNPPHTLLKPNQLMLASSTLANISCEIIDDEIKDRIKKGYLKDPLIKSIYADLTKGTLNNRLTSIYKLNSEGLVTFNGLIYIPNINELKVDILRRHHDSLTAGHFGQAKTLESLSRNYYFPKMRNFVDSYIRSCDMCARCKSSRHAPYGHLHSLPVPTQPWHSISMDFIVKLPPSKDPSLSNSPSFDSILVMVDRLTKMAYFIPCNETISAPQLAQLYIKYIFPHHGIPKEIVSDRGSVFVSNFIRALCEALNITQLISTAYHPQTDGQTERVNQILEQYLRVYTNYEQDNWVELLPFAQFAYNNTEQSSIKSSPFFANYGYHPNLDVSVQAETHSPAVEERIQQLRSLHKVLQHEMKFAQTQQSRYYDQHRQQGPKLQVGDKVWLLRRHIKTTRPSEKLDHRKLGPFVIEKVLNPVAFKLKLPSTMRIHPVFHISLLERAVEDETLHPSPSSPPPIVVEGQSYWEIEAIVNSRLRKQRGRPTVEYEVKWKGYSDYDNTWEPYTSLKDTVIDMIKDFHKENPQAPRPSSLRF